MFWVPKCVENFFQKIGYPSQISICTGWRKIMFNELQFLMPLSNELASSESLFRVVWVATILSRMAAFSSSSVL